MYIPANVVTNNDLANSWTLLMKWIQERTGIKERHFAQALRGHYYYHGRRGAKVAIERAGITAQDIDLIIFATLSPDIFSRAAEYYCNAC